MEWIDGYWAALVNVSQLIEPSGPETGALYTAIASALAAFLSAMIAGFSAWQSRRSKAESQRVNTLPKLFALERGIASVIERIDRATESHIGLASMFSTERRSDDVQANLNFVREHHDSLLRGRELIVTHAERFLNDPSYRQVKEAADFVIFWEAYLLHMDRVLEKPLAFLKAES